MENIIEKMEQALNNNQYSSQQKVLIKKFIEDWKINIASIENAIKII